MNQASPERNKKVEADDYDLIAPSRGWFSINFAEIWRYRELLYFLIWRDIKVRYKQTMIGIVWAILKPLATMVIFSVVLGNFAKMPSDNLPYPVFLYSALLAWTYFSDALSSGGTSLVASSNLVSKVYFPRLIVPLASIVTPVLDFFLSFLVLLGLMVWFAIMPTWKIMALPFFLLFTALTAFSVSLWLSALNVKYRDVGYAIPFCIQLWMFASPVIYPTSLIPERLRFFYNLNPMVGVIEGFRWVLLNKASPDFAGMGISIGVVLALLFGGLVYFRRMELTFADVI